MVLENKMSITGQTDKINRTTKIKLPIAIFDSHEYLKVQIANEDFSHLDSCYNIEDIKQAQMFLMSYQGSIGTFNAYRNEIERLLQWCHVIVDKSLKDLKRDDIENFIKFCQKPPKQWIGSHKPPRFIEKDEARIPNPEWRPFIVTVSKAKHREGERPNIKDYELSQMALRDC